MDLLRIVLVMACLAGGAYAADAATDAGNEPAPEPQAAAGASGQDEPDETNEQRDEEAEADSAGPARDDPARDDQSQEVPSEPLERIETKETLKANSNIPFPQDI